MSTAVMHSSPTYTFSSQPRAVTQKKKYRSQTHQDEPPAAFYGNIMYDKRVVRGTTYGRHHITKSSASIDATERKEEIKRREAPSKDRRQKQMRQFRSETPIPVEGRLHANVQTELYLEELIDRIEEKEACCQTDEFLDRPPTPLYRPAKSGLDVSTQIEDNELFDFNMEVQPILEVLVGKTIEQALLEVSEEEELAALRQQQREFEERRLAERCEYARLEEQDRRYREEKARRIAEQAEKLRLEKETADKIAAQAFAHGYVSDLIPAVFSNLDEHGYFYDAVERELENELIPWLQTAVDERLDRHVQARLVLDGMIREVIRDRSELFTANDVHQHYVDDYTTDNKDNTTATEGASQTDERPANDEQEDEKQDNN